MKYGSIVMAILLFIGLYSTVQSQSVQTNGLRDRQITHLPIVGTNVPQGISREFLGTPSTHRLHIGFATGIDSLRMKGSSYSFPNDRFIPNGLQRGSNPTLAQLSVQSLISVIDTAIVRSTVDTTRHVYSFNAKAKMTSHVTQKLRGDLWVDTRQNTITYDAKGNWLSWSFESWSNGQWVNIDRYTKTYDANGNNLSSLYEVWSNGQWVNSSRYTYTYDMNGHVLLYLSEHRENGLFVNFTRVTFTYDVSGNRLSLSAEAWSNGEWVHVQRWTYTYDANGNILSDLVDLGGSPVPDSVRDTYTYDVNGHILSYLEEHSSNAQWVNSERFTYAYDTNGNRTTQLWESWGSSQWVNFERYTYTYDASGNELSELDEDWSNGQWVNNGRNTYTYDANGEETSSLSQLWSNGQWVNDYRWMYTYDAQENLTSVWFHRWLNSSWTPTDTWGFPGYSVINVSPIGYNLGIGYNFTFVRKLIVSGVASQSGVVPATYSLSQNYPNPFNPTSVISYQLPASSNVRLVVYDLIGREVSVLVSERKEAGSYTVQFNAGGLASGVYFYRLSAGSFTETKKLLLVR